MQVNVLGPVEVVRDGVAVAVGGARMRALLTRLALARGRAVPAAELIDAVWGDVDSDDPANALQSLVSRLRRALGDPGAVVQTPGGYRLAVTPDDVDVHRFESAVQAGRADLRAHRYDQAAARLRAALGLWRGTALVDLGDVPAAAALEELRQSANEDRLEADIRSGHPGDAASELEAVVAASPLRERATALLMDALVADGRGAQALAAYERTRAVLVDELGADPGAALTQRHLEILRTDPTGPPTPVPAPQRTNLRAALTSFVGRETDMAAVAERLAGNRLVTLVGPGGAGKTRLATELGAASADRFVDGVWLIELAAVTDPGDVVGAVVGTLGMRETALFETRAASAMAVTASRRGALDRLREALAERNLLLILDNCEHLLDAVAELIEYLLTRCPRVKILTTSRESLALPGESLYPVPPLGQRAGDADGVSWAVQLFLDRARSIRPDAAPSADDLVAVDEICHRLDGLPLAIELAAARTRGLTVRQVADRLNDRFRLLSGGNRVAVARHRTLRAVVEWSWGLLTGDEQWLLEHLSVFAGGVTVESADAIWTAAGRSGDTLDLLAALVDKSLLQLVGDGQPRYRLLETIREFGVDRLAERGDLAQARSAHAEYFRIWAVYVEPFIRTSEQLRWIERLNSERDNLFAAIQHLVDVADADAAVELAVALGWFWTMRGEHAVATTWLGAVLRVEGGTDSVGRTLAHALRTMNSGIWSGATDELVGNVEALAQYDDPDRYPMAVVMRAVGLIFGDDSRQAAEYVDAMITRTDGWPQATLYMLAALLAENSGDVGRTRHCLGHALSAFRELGERFGLASCLELHARIAMLDADLDETLAALAQAATITRELGAYEDAGQAMCISAGVHVRLGQMDAARADLERAEADFARVGSVFGAVLCDSVHSLLDRVAGRLDEARARITLARKRMADDVRYNAPQAMAMLVGAAADVEFDAGDLILGAALTAETVDVAATSQDLPIVAYSAVLAAKLSWLRGDHPLAAQLLGAADELRGAPDPTHPDVITISADLRERLGEDEFVRRLEAGRSLPRDAATRLLTESTRV